MANSKKIALFLVEGSTDSTALGLVISRLLKDTDVRFHVLNGDICYRFRIAEDNAAKSVMRAVNGFLQRYRLKKSDLFCIVHIIDTDGAFIPTERVIRGGTENAHYKDTFIETLSVDSIRSRNELKTAAAQALCKLSDVENVPYAFYYFSRNIEHVLHDRSDSLSSREKRIFSEKFETLYADHPLGFLELLRSPEVAVRGSYRKTWEYIFRNTNSLKRGCNLALFFDWYEKQKEK